MDKLEEFIRKNRKDMDRYSPSSGMWKRIECEIKSKKSQIGKWLSIAAMIIVIISSAVLFYKPAARGSRITSEINKDGIVKHANPQLKEMEIYYSNLMNSLYREAIPLLTGNPEIEKEFTFDISQLDSICSDIKKDLKDNVDNQEVVEALIQNYRIKIRLLEDMLLILKENEENQEKSNNYEL